MQESIVFLERVQCPRKESSRSLSHLLMIFLLSLQKQAAINLEDLYISHRRLTTVVKVIMCSSGEVQDASQALSSRNTELFNATTVS